MEASIRTLPPSTIGEASLSEVKAFVAEMKGSALDAIVEQVRDGSTIRVYLIPSFRFLRIFVAGIQVIYKYTPSLVFFSLTCMYFFYMKYFLDPNDRLHPWEDEHPFQLLQLLKQKLLRTFM